MQGKDSFVNTPALIDTGNKIEDCVAISSELAKALKLPVHACKTQIGTAAKGGRMSAVGHETSGEGKIRAQAMCFNLLKLYFRESKCYGSGESLPGGSWRVGQVVNLQEELVVVRGGEAVLEVWMDLQMNKNELMQEHPKVCKQVRRLIYVYCDIFSQEAPGHTDLMTMKLHLKPGSSQSGKNTASC